MLGARSSRLDLDEMKKNVDVDCSNTNIRSGFRIEILVAPKPQPRSGLNELGQLVRQPNAAIKVGRDASSCTVDPCIGGRDASLTRLPVTDVTIYNLVRFPLLSQLPSPLDQGFRPVLFQVVIGHDLTADELVLKVGATAWSAWDRPRLAWEQRRLLDDTGSLWRLDAFSDGPGPYLVRTTYGSLSAFAHAADC